MNYGTKQASQRALTSSKYDYFRVAQRHDKQLPFGHQLLLTAQFQHAGNVALQWASCPSGAALKGRVTLHWPWRLSPAIGQHWSALQQPSSGICCRWPTSRPAPARMAASPPQWLLHTRHPKFAWTFRCVWLERPAMQSEVKLHSFVKLNRTYILGKLRCVGVENNILSLFFIHKADSHTSYPE